MKQLRLLIIFAFIVFSNNVLAAQKLLTIIHTNDLHSHLQGFSPEIDYRPDSAKADVTVGGWSRIAAVIKKTKNEKKNPVLVLDSGDYFMGSLFHMTAREEAWELRLLGMMGYDVVTLGNHEFDLKPAGLARILKAAHTQGKIPQIVFASAIFTADNPKDAPLRQAFQDVGVKPYIVLERDGLKIGIFGILGKDAAAVSPFAVPVKFRDPLEVSREMVQALREKEKVDIVICLSHSGLQQDSKKSEDEILAREVKGIDIIVSGHTHTLHQSPVQAGNTTIMHAWVYGKHVGILDIAYEDGRVTQKGYQTVVINSEIKGTDSLQKAIDGFKETIDAKILAEHGLSYDKIIAKTGWDLRVIDSEESSLGNLLADAVRWSVDRQVFDKNDPQSRVAVAIESGGVIRDDLLKGKTGHITAGDLFRTVPLGIGADDTMGYPLISFYIYGYEIKRALEILTSVAPMKNPDYFLQVSGLRVSYNPNRVIFDRVTNIELADAAGVFQKLDYSKTNRRLYRVAANIYNSTFLKVIGNYTYNFLHIVPKDRNGQPVNDLTSLLVDTDKTKPGVQELKQWLATMQYVQSFPDTNGDGLPDLPEKYRGKQGRINLQASWNPVNLVANCAAPTYIVITIIAIIMALLIIIVAIILARRKAKKS